MKAIVTGGASGIGAAIVARLRAENVDVEVLDLRHGFDVGEADHWEAVGAVDVACLNAGSSAVSRTPPSSLWSATARR